MMSFRGAVPPTLYPARYLVLQALIALLLISPTTAFAQSARAEVDPDKVFLNQHIVYGIILTDAPGAKVGELKVPDGLQVVQRRPPTEVRRRRSLATVTIYSYVIRATKAGKLTIVPPEVNYLGELLKIEPVEVEVVGPQDSELFELVARVEPKAVYPLQRFTIELDVNLKGLDEPNTVFSPVSARIVPALTRLTIPWLDDDLIPKGLQADPFDFRSIASPSRTGFGINGLNRVVGFFDDREERVFLPQEEKLTRVNASGEDTRWFRYRFRRSFLPIKPGRYQFGKASMTGSLAARIEGTKAIFEDVFNVSDRVDVEVKPLPLDSRPDSWCGVIGDLDVKSSIAPLNARVGEPLTLTLSLTGAGLLSDAFPPKLSANDRITDGFRVYEATSTPTKSGRTFTYSLRATKPGKVQFPPIELSWFDPAREKYVTGRTSPVSLTITQAETLTADSIVSSQTTRSQAIAATSGGLAANMTSVRIRNVQPFYWFCGWSSLTAVTAVAWLLLGRLGSADRIAGAKRKQLFDEARSHLNDGLKALDARETDSAINKLRDAINLVANAVSGSNDSGVTTEEATSKLKDAGIDSELVDRSTNLLNKLDEARYAGLAESADQLRQQAKSTIGELIKAGRGVRL